ncbi:synaptotagmin-like protein 2 [Esox lucius]|uniref:Synaptotagmin-like protein 1 n=1 Tax=Esox lucius TaxID=8010 RepID=A0AAY5KU48_ESOLU|nr:synaptotagmin-like protein 2 [Esox lucius]XP_010866438.2 synaptotagmin-like protein 2 [Esox lucius]XP_010866439.2 synaptotagmin-like protein 2 [Esox lucius]
MMKSTQDISEYLDLSYLSTDEELAIRQVLQRDENLKRQETGRIRRLHYSIPDPKMLKIMTGQWFQELRNRRYGRHSDVTDVVRSSMKKKTTVLRSDPSCNVGQTENKGAEKENDPQTKTSEIKKPYPRFINPVVHEEGHQQKNNLENSVDTENNSVAVPEKKHKLYRSHEGPASEEKPTKPFTSSNQHCTKPYFSTTHAVYQSQDRKPSQRKETESVHATPMSLLGPTNISSMDPQSNSSTETLDTIANLKSNNNLVVFEIKNEPEKKSPVSYADPYEPTQAQLKSTLIEAKPKDIKIEIGTNKSIVVDVENSGNEPLAILSLEILATRPKPEVNYTSTMTNTTEVSPSTEILSWTDNKSQNKRPDFQVLKYDESASMPTSEAMFQKDQLLLESEDTSGMDVVRLNQNVSTESQEQKDYQNQSETVSYKNTFSFQRSVPSPTTKESTVIECPQFSPEKYVPVDPSLVRKPVSLVLSSEESPPVAVHFLEEIIVSDNLLTQNESNEEGKEKYIVMYSKDGHSGTEMLGSGMHGTKIAHRVSPKVVGEEKKGEQIHFSEQMDVKMSESLRKAADGQTLDEDNVGIFKESKNETKHSLNGDIGKVNQTGKLHIPAIVVNSSESPVTEKAKEPPAVLQKPQTMAATLMDTWEDEDLDSDDDRSSFSSYGSDIVAKRGYGTNALAISGRTESLLSVYSEAGDFGTVTVCGAVEFALKYTAAGELIITVEQCQDLAYANPRKQRTDPYIKTYLHPDKSRNSKRKTSIKKRTINPVYGGETLKYNMKMDGLKGRTLKLSVWHNDFRGRNVFLGQVNIDLKTWDWWHESLTWYNLQPKNPEGQESYECHGILIVALKYSPPGSTGNAKDISGEIHVWLKEARNLRRLKPKGVDSFVKCYMLPDTSKKSRQKTGVVKKNQEPVYNHAMVYDGFRAGEAREACCELTVWDHNTLSNQFLGGVRLSLGTGQSYGKTVDWMDSVNEEITLWEKMLASPGAWVEGEIPLRSSMTPRK